MSGPHNYNYNGESRDELIAECERLINVIRTSQTGAFNSIASHTNEQAIKQLERARTAALKLAKMQRLLAMKVDRARSKHAARRKHAKEYEAGRDPFKKGAARFRERLP